VSLLVVVLIATACLVLAYWAYGSLLCRLLRLDPAAKTPAVELRDDVDYAPIEAKFLLGQHFSAIAAAGPIVGPIMAGVAFGWLPAILWIVLGAILIGGVHDLTALVASIRHQARSITEVVREHMSRRAFVLFLVFIWITLVHVIVAFTDFTASQFVGKVVLENEEEVLGGAIATSSLLYLALPIVMALLMRYAKLSLLWATLIFLPLVGVAIWIGPSIPLQIESLLGVEAVTGQKIWGVLLLGYCFVAALVPMWLLLQPRGHLGGYFLYAALFAAAAGLILGGGTVKYPAFIGWTAPNGDALFPFLFITIACGACSGFHSVVASGTTCKQLKLETDAKVIGYGAMLLEGLVAVVSLCCVMMLAQDDPMARKSPNFVYASGVGKFLEVFHVPAALGISFGLMAFTTFVYDTLDICTRLGRYILEELTGWRGGLGRWFANGVTAGAPLILLMQTITDAQGKVVPAGKVFWPLFGASNQLLAALTLLGVTVWLLRTRRARWPWLVTGLPALVMYVMSVWALVLIIRTKFGGQEGLLAWAAIVLIGLAALMLVEAVRALARAPATPPAGGLPDGMPAPASR
jgi:carbon starvation protein